MAIGTHIGGQDLLTLLLGMGCVNEVLEKRLNCANLINSQRLSVLKVLSCSLFRCFRFRLFSLFKESLSRSMIQQLKTRTVRYNNIILL